jgi:hypothetical protein
LGVWEFGGIHEVVGKFVCGQRRENYRNGSGKKTLLSEDGKLEIDEASTKLDKNRASRPHLRNALPATPATAELLIPALDDSAIELELVSTL